MWCSGKFFAKQTKKMIAGQTGLLRNLIQVEWLLIALVDEGARATEPLMYFTSRFGIRLTHFLGGSYFREAKSGSE